MQPQPPARTAPGWYDDPDCPGVIRYHDGAQWTRHARVAGGAPPPQQQTVVVSTGAGPRYVSGVSTGWHLVHGVLTVCTVGVWGVVWWLHWRLGRRRIR